MTSTVVDAVLALLLLSAAVVVVGQPGHFGVADGTSVDDERTETAGADAMLETLATATASLNYSLGAGARHADPAVVDFPRDTGPEFHRTSHGSLLELLVQATLARVVVDGDPLTRTGDGFRTAVRTPLEEVLGWNAHVAVRWAPYPDAPVEANIDVGSTPSPDRAVHGATTQVPLGPDTHVSPADRRHAVAEGYPGVARLAANRTVEVVFPEKRTALALGGDYPLASLVAYRYQRFADAVDLTLAEPLTERDARTANRRLTGALAARFEADLRERYASPAAAARAFSVDRVAVVVRTWSA